MRTARRRRRIRGMRCRQIKRLAFRLTGKTRQGVPISAFIFGGRRARLAPLVYEPTSWEHGVFVAATMASETTAAMAGAVGVTRRDPMAMLPFCGYNMGDYFQHWLEMGRSIPHPPKIFHVNWFRRDSNGKFLWPGFGENARVLKWILERVEGRGKAKETPIGFVPTADALTLDGLDISHEAMEELLRVNPVDWVHEMEETGAFLEKFGDRLPGGVASPTCAVGPAAGDFRQSGKIGAHMLLAAAKTNIPTLLESENVGNFGVQGDVGLREGVDLVGVFGRFREGRVQGEMEEAADVVVLIE